MKPMSYYTPNSNLPAKISQLISLGDDNVVYERITNNDAPTNSRKRIRRSRYDQEGRSFICTCGKSYLSYAALYWHIKVKHNGVDPSNNQPLPNKKQLQYQNQRILTDEDGVPTSIVVAGSKKVMQSGRKKGNMTSTFYQNERDDCDYLEYDSDEKANRELVDFFSARGGPTHPLQGMDLRVSYEIKESEDSPDMQLQRAVQHFTHQNLEKPTSRKLKVKEETKRSMKPISTLNKVMAQYLIEMSQISQPWFYKQIVFFVKIYLTCVCLFNEDCHKRVAMESVPEIGTMYMINKMKDMSTIFDVPLAIVLNKHFIGWLRRNRKSVGIDVIPALKN